MNREYKLLLWYLLGRARPVSTPREMWKEVGTSFLLFKIINNCHTQCHFKQMYCLAHCFLYFCFPSGLIRSQSNEIFCKTQTLISWQHFSNRFGVFYIHNHLKGFSVCMYSFLVHNNNSGMKMLKEPRNIACKVLKQGFKKWVDKWEYLQVAFIWAFQRPCLLLFWRFQ